MLGATIEHKFNNDLKLRNQTQFNYVNTDARRDGAAMRSAPCRQRRLHAGSDRHRRAGRPYSALPLTNLYVRQQSHDRNIYDIVALQPDRAQRRSSTPGRSSTHAAGRHRARATRPTTTRTTSATASATASRSDRRRTSGYVGCTPLLYPGQRRQFAGQRAEQCRQPCDRRSAKCGRRLFQRHDQRHPAAQAGRRRALGPLLFADRQLDQHRQHAGQHDAAAMPSRPSTSPACAAADLRSRRRSSPTTSRTAPRSIRRSSSWSRPPAPRQPLPPENNKAYEVGVKYDLFKAATCR